jgi:hypothetical protein
MPKSAKKQASDNRWDRNNLKLVAVRLRKEQAEAFKEKCKEKGTSCYSVLKKAVDDFMKE